MIPIFHAILWTLVFVAYGCAPVTNPAPEPAAAAVLRNAAGEVVGEAVLTETAGAVRMKVEARRLTPGAHGIHLHAVGSCDAATATPFSSAGGHFNPHGREHGRSNPAGWHAGDLPNLPVAESGRGSLDTPLEGVTLAEGTGALFDADGAAVVIHANADDERTNAGPQGPGNSGARVVCGVLERR